MRVIPKTAKVKAEFFRKISIPDVCIGLVCLGLEILVLLTELETIPKVIVACIIFAPFFVLYLPLDGQRFYVYIVNFAKYTFSVKQFDDRDNLSQNNIDYFIPIKGFNGKYILYKGYKASVLEIEPREFNLLSEYRQNQIIDDLFGKVIRSINGKTKASIVKIDRKLYFDKFIKEEEEKRKELYKQYETGELTKKELAARELVVDDRIRVYSEMSDNNKIEKPFYYLVVYDDNENILDEIMANAVNCFSESGMHAKVLEGRELGVFVKYTYTNNLDERDVEQFRDEEFYQWCMPHEIKFGTHGAWVDGEECYTYTIRDFPVSVYNAWGYQLFNIPDTKVVMNLEPYEKNKAVRMIDRSLQELSSQSENTFRASSMIDKQTHIATLVDVLRMLQNDNEILFSVTLHITIYVRGHRQDRTEQAKKNLRKTIKRIIAEGGFDVSENIFTQNRALISSNISRYDAMDEFSRSIQSGSVAACFPFVLSNIMDDHGVILGVENNYPLIVNFFKRDSERVNSNMVIMGKSGSGKSYATKTLLSNLAAENCKIFILDPENEYLPLSKNLGGRLIDVGTATQGRINPFHVITTLSADEEDDENAVDNFAVHLQFLEEYFRVVLPGASSGASEYLNNLIVELYKRKGIDRDTNFSKLEPKDYPIFDDLYALVQEKMQLNTNSPYDTENLRELNNYISKFAANGRNSNLWNGESTLSVKENFCVFNFQSLLANKNGTIANAQMLLVLKWLDNEIIKNREFNIKHGTNRKIVVAIDEAHVFIDPKYPVALDFMYQLAKRIRKYNGMQIVITQNIKDFVGSPDIVRKSTAIINACQYSFIFALAPNDMDDLCTLYDKAGKINQSEQDQIVNNGRGHAFIITSPTSRTNIGIVASNKIKTLFGE